MIRMKKRFRFLGLAVLIAAGMSCGDVVRQSQSPSYLVLDSLAGIRGAVTLGPPTTVLISDVITNITAPPPCTPAAPCPTIFGDSGQAVIHLAMKNPGPPTSPAVPSQVNAITLNRFHVAYARTDGRNTPGVDVPYPIDGAITVTVSSTSSVTFGFELVRLVAKEETPLVQLINSNQFISTLANVTFYGRDQAGNDASVTGAIEIQFGNFGDF